MTVDRSDVMSKLKAAQFFQNLSAEDRKKIDQIASIQKVPCGTILYREGDICQALHVVVSGRIGLEMCPPRRGCIRFLTVGEGELLSWSALLGNGIMTARAVVLEDAELIALPASQLLDLCETDHDIGYAIMQQTAKTLSRRLLATRLQTLDIYQETLPVAR